MKAQRPKPKRTGPGPSPIDRFGGPVETVAASLPKELVDAVRAHIGGKREFSRFVAEALARELIDRNRAEFVIAMEAIHGPVDQEFVTQVEDVLGR